MRWCISGRTRLAVRSITAPRFRPRRAKSVSRRRPAVCWPRVRVVARDRNPWAGGLRVRSEVQIPRKRLSPRAEGEGSAPTLLHPRLGYRLRPLHVLVVPAEKALKPILAIARNRDAVERIAIDHELCLHAERAERLIHLLAADDGHVDVALAAHEQRRRLDAIGVEEGIGDVDPLLLCLPGHAELLLVLRDVLVRAIHGELQRAARAAHSALEPRCGRNRVAGEHSAVAPAPNA